VSRHSTTTRYFLFFPVSSALVEVARIGTATILHGIERDDNINKRYVD
jgi:hypothetical protein